MKNFDIVTPESLQVYNPICGDVDLLIKPLTPSCFNSVMRSRYYSIIWIKQGHGEIVYEFNTHPFKESYIMFFTPYQPFIIKNGKDISGTTIHFANDFFCIEKHSKEVACNGVLFNNAYSNPYIKINEEDKSEFDYLIKKMLDGLKQEDNSDHELLFSYLKIFLIHASKIKMQQSEITNKKSIEPNQHILIKLKDLIEENYKSVKSPKDYAEKLYMTPKSLGKLVKDYLNKTLTEIIHERIIIEAKREIFLTKKPIKEIAQDLGYHDQYYFSRLFKKVTSVSPETYKKTIHLT